MAMAPMVEGRVKEHGQIRRLLPSSTPIVPALPNTLVEPACDYTTDPMNLRFIRSPVFGLHMLLHCPYPPDYVWLSIW